MLVQPCLTKQHIILVSWQAGLKCGTGVKVYCKVRLAHTNKLIIQHTSHEAAYVYFRMPSNLDVQIITLLSAPPDANLFPVTEKGYNISPSLTKRT